MMGLKIEKRKKQKKNKKKKMQIFGSNKIVFYCNDVMYFLFVYRYLSVSMLFKTIKKRKRWVEISSYHIQTILKGFLENESKC